MVVPLIRADDITGRLSTEGLPSLYEIHMPKVLNKKKDFIHPDAVYVGRGSPYGNPFRLGIDGTREEVIHKFVTLVLPNLDVSTLRGKDLVCFCAPKKCHADFILIKANNSLEEWL